MILLILVLCCCTLRASAHEKCRLTCRWRSSRISSAWQRMPSTSCPGGNRTSSRRPSTCSDQICTIRSFFILSFHLSPSSSVAGHLLTCIQKTRTSLLQYLFVPLIFPGKPTYQEGILTMMLLNVSAVRNSLSVGVSSMHF